MNEEVKRMMLNMAEDSYKTGFNNACEIMLEGLNHLSSKGYVVFTHKDIKDMLSKAIELNNSQPDPYWSKFGI